MMTETMKRDALAEAVAQHGDIPRGARQIGVTTGEGRRLWHEIVRGLGRQAR